MKRSAHCCIFVVFGSNMFLHFIPMPPPPEGPAREFMTALFLSHYLYVVGTLQVVGGFLLFGGQLSAPQQAKSVDVKIELPKVEKK